MEAYNLSLEQVKSYLSATKWKYKALPTMNSIVYVPSDNTTPNNYLYIPFKENPLTLEDDIKNILYDLSRIKNSYPEDMYREILKYSTLPVDCLDLRLISRLSDTGTIPLGFATSVLDSLKKLITDSITYEISSKRHHSRITPNANDIYDNFIFNQTKKGSFIFSIQTGNLSLTNDTLCLEGFNEMLPPLERRAIERIQFTMQNVAESLRYKNISKSIEYLLSPQIMDTMNANMCDALIDIFDEHAQYMKKQGVYGDLKIESTATFSPVVKAKNNTIHLKHTVEINSYASEILKFVSSELKRDDDNSLEVIRLIGTVVSLALDKSDIYKGHIKVQIANHREIKTITVPLCTLDYNLALDAQKHNHLVALTGIPMKNPVNNRWTLEQLSAFEALSTNAQQSL